MKKTRTKRITLDQLKTQIPILVEKQNAAQIMEMYPCTECEALHHEKGEAADCCAWKMDSLYVCSICDKAGGEESMATDDWCFDTEKECQAHISARHGIAADSETVLDKYLDALREGKANCQWKFEMEQTTEFVIPNG